ncbi:hypothetical protein A2165_02010 [Candidatus Curtissbacteria bacterium RBG_13_40_7]|uniref:PIN domain-containing protein n=1 Tax=Candidatus Curtissbacteria bacterium RBG_13_40_7 TaxID=1797706 RepID=A0A1F5FZG8_9BACT|nr:MAG: hypothetical protein A2165_02010 [Candidatus Curtissbacteria bacterium RBG_13_40_7]
MEVAVDSHALLWYLSKNPKLTPKAFDVLAKASRIIVSTIVLLELLYILQKFGQERKFKNLLDSLNSEKYLVYPVDLALVRDLSKLPKNLEMHDRLIVATAKIFNVSLITKDKQIAQAYKMIIW